MMKVVEPRVLSRVPVRLPVGFNQAEMKLKDLSNSWIDSAISDFGFDKSCKLIRGQANPGVRCAKTEFGQEAEHRWSLGEISALETS
jgi:hypothetical protein